MEAREDALTELQIQHVVCCAREIRHKYNPRAGISVLRLLLEDQDEEPLFPAVADAFEFIEEHLSVGRSVLVHCMAGISRSSAVILYYLMRKNRWCYETALSTLSQVHPDARPNKGYVNQLRLYAAEQELT